jgi:hypothetical protein
MFTIKRTVLALALCVATVSVVYAQARRQDSTSTDAKLENLFPGTALAQKQEQAAVPDTNTAAAVIGPPVKCGATGWRDGGTAYLIIKMLNPTKGTVDITGLNTDGIPWGNNRTNRLWKYKNGVLDYAYKERYRIHLLVGERDLTGSFFDFSAPLASLPKITYNCDGPINRVIVR